MVILVFFFLWSYKTLIDIIGGFSKFLLRKKNPTNVLASANLALFDSWEKPNNAQEKAPPPPDSWGLRVLDILQGLGPLMGLCSTFQARIDFYFLFLIIFLWSVIAVQLKESVILDSVPSGKQGPGTLNNTH